MTNENVEAIFSRNGPFSPRSEVPPEIVSAYRGKLPDVLLAIWRDHGVGVWGGGLFQLCVPNAFDGLLSQIFHADSDFSHRDCHVIGYGPFGNLLVWSERHWMSHIHLNRSEVICPGLIAPARKRSTESIVATVLFGISKDVAAKTNLILDRCSRLQIRRVTGIDRGAGCGHVSPPASELCVRRQDRLRRLTTAHIYLDHLENSSALLGLSNVTDLSIHLGGEKFDERDIELFQKAILNLAYGKLARLKIFVVEGAGELARGTFNWPHTELVVTIEVVPTKPQPKRQP